MSNPSHDDDEPRKEELAEGTLMSHLLELRSRLLKCVLSVGVVALCLVPFAERIYTIISAPLRAVLPGDMIVTGVASSFMTPIKAALFVALYVAMPAVLYQVWQFVAPALYRTEKKFALPLLVSSVLLFYAGMAFAYFVVFPVMFKFFAGSTPTGVAMMTDIALYLDTVLTLFLAFGAAFETPIATVLLIASGLVSTKTLADARPYVFIGTFVAGMLLAPDAFSMTLMAIPMYLLYEAGMLLARYLFPAKIAAQQAAT